MEALLPRFRAAHTQVLGVSVDSVYSHSNWGASLGGISFPLLADFQPKGGMAADYGLYMDGPGITDRATVIIDQQGIVRHASSVTPGGRRQIADLAALCEEVDGRHGAGLQPIPEPAGLPAGAALYLKSHCGHSRAVSLVRQNLHLIDALPAHNVSEDAQARERLLAAAGKDQAPALLHSGQVVHEAAAINAFLVQAASDIAGD